MRRIESLSNPQIKLIRRILTGSERSHYLIEGTKLFQEAMSSDISIKQVFLTEEIWKKEKHWLKKLEDTGTQLFFVVPAIMKRVSDVETPSGLLGIIRKPEVEDPGLPSRYAAFLFSIRDPGNMGTIIRAAEATGCEFVACTPDCAQPFRPKVIRASMGSSFRIPVHKIRDPFDYLQEARINGVSVFALQPRSPKTIFHMEPKFPSLVLIGSESKGLPPDLPIDEEIGIPMTGKVESLNAAMAATICFYWLFSNRLDENENR